MKELPMLFRGPLVRAILDGKKTQTRRRIRWSDKSVEYDGCSLFEQKDGTYWPYNCSDGNENPIACPYGRAGDRLWVRETFRVCDVAGEAFRPSEISPTNAHIYYRSDPEPGGNGPWKPSIHMPKWACRLRLDVEAVRVERLQEITAMDVFKEGIGSFASAHIDVAREMFAQTWNQIHGNEAWHDNPWVWVIEFSRVDST